MDAVLQHILPQGRFDECFHAPIGYPFGHQGHEALVWDGVELAFQIRTRDMPMPAFEQSVELSQRVFATTSGSKPIPMRGKLLLEDWFDH